MSYKQCMGCAKITKEFSSDVSTNDGRRSYCKPCDNSRARIYRAIKDTGLISKSIRCKVCNKVKNIAKIKSVNLRKCIKCHFMLIKKISANEGLVSILNSIDENEKIRSIFAAMLSIEIEPF